MAKRVLSPVEAVLQSNVKRLIDKHYDGKPFRLKQKNPRVRLATVQDIIKGGGCTVASLGALADALNVSPYQLLVRDLDVNDPQEAVSAKQVRAIKQLQGEK